MAYPNAYCVKCGTHTNTEKKHTVLLQNNSRALSGVCPKCESKVYKILPKGKNFKTTMDADHKGTITKQTSKQLPRAYCVKCQDFTLASNAKTVVLKNGVRAMKGNCKQCSSESYRILGKERLRSVHPGEIKLKSSKQNVNHVHPRSTQDMAWALWLALGVITGVFATVLFLV